MQILVVGSETRVCNAAECIIAVQGHFRVNQGTNRKNVFDFLLVINSNLCRISHRLGDTAAYLLVQNRQFAATQPSFNALALGDPLRIFGLI